MVGGPSNNDEANSGCEAGVVVEEKRVATGLHSSEKSVQTATCEGRKGLRSRAR
jgi:hypothetical protein